MSTIVINVYRPPNTSYSSFNALLQKVQEYLDDVMCERYYDIDIMGDFNFPNIEWVSHTCIPSQGREQYESAEALLNFINHNMLTQVIDKPTRNGNILELFLTNNDRIIRNIDVQETKLSDHDLVSVNLLHHCMTETSPTSLPTFEKDSFRSLNLYKTDFVKVNDILNDVNWDALFQLYSNDLSGNSFIELLRLTVLQACTMFSPKKIAETESPRKAKTEHSRKRYILNRKRRKLNARLKSLRLHKPPSTKIKQLEDQISLIYFDIKDSHNAEHTRQEKLAVAKVI